MNENLDKVLKEYYESDILLPEGVNNKVYNKLIALEKQKSKISILIYISFIILNVSICLLLNIFVGTMIIKLILYIYLVSCIFGSLLISYVNSKLGKEVDYTKESVVL